MEKITKIAVTGGIGSGKSEVMKLISALGYYTVSLDEVYAELLKDEEFVRYLSNAMGVLPIYEGEKVVLDKKTISKIVFSNKERLNKLNSITHEAIFNKAFSIHDNGIVFYEVPLLFEGNYQDKFDFIIIVLRDKTERIKAVKCRDGCTESEVESRINSQFDYEKIDTSLHMIIENNSDLNSLNSQVIKVVKFIEKQIHFTKN